MSVFNVELKKVVDDSYDIEIGYNLKDQLVDDLETGLLGSVKKLAVITDSNVRDLYAKPICEKLIHAGYKVDLFVFPAGEKSKTRKTKERIEDAMLEKGYRRDCAIIAIGGGVVTDRRNIWQRSSFHQLCDNTACGSGCIGRWKDSGGYATGNQPYWTV